MTIRIYHNPRCTKSRKTLALLEENGISPQIVLYLETPPSPKELGAILAALGAGARDIIRKGEAPYKDLNLADPAKTDAQLITAMVAHPILIERPIVVNSTAATPRAKIGRPPEAVLEIL